MALLLDIFGFLSVVLRGIVLSAQSLVLGGIFFLALLAYFAPRIFISIGSGQAGVKWRRFFGGTVTISSNGKPFIGRIDTDAYGNPTRLGSVPKG